MDDWRGKVMVASRSPIIDKVDRKLAFSFGAVMLVLMLLVTGASSYLFIRLQSQEEDRLSGALARIIAESVGKVSFSGTYHARLFVEEIKAKSPEIRTVSLVSKEGRIIAHSNPDRNGAMLTGEDLALLRQCLAHNSTVVGERYRNGGKEKVIVLPYGGGVDAEIIGVIRLVIDVAGVSREQRTGIVTMVVIATVLSCMAVVFILLLSRYFGSAVKELAMQLQAILDNSPALIYVKDRTGHYQFVNKAWCDLFQTANNDVKGKTDLELFPEDVARQFMTNDQLVMQSDTQLTLEERLPMDEEIRYYHSIKVAVRDTNGATYGLCGISTDISERKKAEDALRKTALLLNEAQRIAHLGHWELDLRTNTLFWSEEIYRIFEIDPTMFGASYEAFLQAIHPDDREFVNTAYTNSLKTRSPYSIDHRLLLSGGRVKYVHEQCETHYEHDTPVRSLGTVQDITGQKLVEERLRSISAELEQRVGERTAELEAKYAELERMNKLFVGRELRMVELKERIRELEGAGLTPDVAKP